MIFTMHNLTNHDGVCDTRGGMAHPGPPGSATAIGYREEIT